MSWSWPGEGVLPVLVLAGRRGCPSQALAQVRCPPPFPRPSPRQNTPWTRYATGGVPLALTQEDFLVTISFWWIYLSLRHFDFACEYCPSYCFFKKQLKDISPFVRPLTPLFWTYGDIYPGFQSWTLSKLDRLPNSLKWKFLWRSVTSDW